MTVPSFILQPPSADKLVYNCGDLDLDIKVDVAGA